MDERAVVSGNIDRLLGLRNYNLPVVAIERSTSEEDVAEIFVRVNSGGQKLMEKNFIETLLAVYDNDMHGKISSFCESARKPQDKTAFNHIIEPDPSHLIRAAVALGFERARLKYAYMLMRGRNLKTGETTKETQAQNLEKFRKAMETVTNLNNWHEFLNLFPAAGYLNSSLIGSTNAVIYCYALYLIGKYRFGVPPAQLRRCITRYIFGVTLTAVYSVSSESLFESQLGELAKCSNAQDYVAYIDGFLTTRLTESYFDVTLSDELKTSSTRSPAWGAFVASQIVLGAQVWLGTSAVSSLLVVGASGQKRAYDKHHIFPKNYLHSLGIDRPVDCNQIANYVFLDYQTNIDISDRSPSEYAPAYRDKLGNEAFVMSCNMNAIPLDFESMSYEAFLKARRELMVRTIKAAYLKLGGKASSV